MTDAEKIAEIAADGVADGMHIVSEEALAAEKVVRAFDSVRLAYLGLGVALGAAVGSVVAFKVAYRKAEAKWEEIANDEIAAMKTHYRQKERALEAKVAKQPLEDLIKERGYSSPEPEYEGPPMAVEPPEAVIEAAREDEEEPYSSPDDPIVKPATPEPDRPVVRNIFRDNAPPEDDWDWHKERASRTPMTPFVMHIDERDGDAALESVTYTYYEVDDVLCNERDEVIPPGDRNKLIGEANLNKFGHGSGDASVVYIYNPQLEMHMEVVRSPNSYAEEVHGFEPPEEPEIRHSIRRGRHTIDDE